METSVTIPTIIVMPIIEVMFISVPVSQKPPDAATIRLRATAIQPAILKALDFYIGGRSSVATSGAVV